MLSSRQLGLWSLLTFEAILTAYSFGNGFPTYGWMALFGGAVLVAALILQRRSVVVPAWVFAALAGMTLLRALWQTVGQPGAPSAVYTSFLVPAGFAAAAYATSRPSTRVLAAGLATMGAARAFFAIWYFQFSVTTLVVANLIAAAGLFAWAYAASQGSSEIDAASTPS